MADKLYDSKTRYFNLAKYHLDLLEETYASGPVGKPATGPDDKPADRSWVYWCDCRDLSLQCTIMCAFAVEAEAIVLLQMTESRHFPEESTRRVFHNRYMKGCHTKRWLDIRTCLDEMLGLEGIQMPSFGDNQNSADELDQLINQRNLYAHFKGRQDSRNPGTWHLDPIAIQISEEGNNSDMDHIITGWVQTARRHWCITNLVYETYHAFWNKYNAPSGR